MRAHVTAIVQVCFPTLRLVRQIRSVRHSLPSRALLTMLRALVISKLDYCNSVLAGAPEVLMRRLQSPSVLNAAAGLVFLSKKVWTHVFITLWTSVAQRVSERINFRLCVLTYHCIHGDAPSYLAETIHPVSSCSTRHRLRSANTSALIVPSTRRCHWRPNVPGGCSKSLELRTTFNPKCSFTDCLSPRTQDCSV